MPENETFVSRWSRRKQHVEEQEQELKSEKESTDIQTKGGSIDADEQDPEQIRAEKLVALNKLTDEDMPDLDSLNEDSDFSMFMSTGVSEGLRRVALHKLFQGKSYNIRDGLDEYDGDYTSFEKLSKHTVTADMKHMVEVEAKRKLAKEQEEERQRKLAAGDIDDSEDIDEFDEFEDEDHDVDDIDKEYLAASTSENYVDEYINVEGFDTTIDDVKNNNDSENEEIA